MLKAISLKLRSSVALLLLVQVTAANGVPRVDRGSVQAAVDGVRLSGAFPQLSHSLAEFYRNEDMGVQWSAAMSARVAALSGQHSADLKKRFAPFEIAQRDVQTSMLAIELINRAKSASYPQQVATTADLRGFKYALKAGTEGPFLDMLGRGNSLLRQLRLAESHYSEIVSDGGWRPLDIAQIALKSRSLAVSALKQRLALEGYNAGEGEYFDTQLQRALRQYQGVQNLTVNGELDEATRRSLNVPAWKRLRSLRANLARFEQRNRLDTHNTIIVNIPAFKGEYFSAGRRVWSDRVIVGMADRRTPQIDSALEQVVFNPSWYVPSKLAYRDILPRASREPDYWQRMGYQALDREGRVYEVQAGSGLPQEFAENRLRIKQSPGPLNALGQVKFLFPNKYAVYLHDTPNKSLFDRDVRTFSSGCVRVQEPLKLARVLFQHQQNHALSSRTDSKVSTIVASQKTQAVTLGQPVNVSTIYLSAEPLASGRVRFHPDVYGYDTAALASRAKTSQPQS